MKIVITKLDRPEHYGDWHDKPLKWLVKVSFDIGDTETQKFTTKKEAKLYASIRRKSSTAWLASREYAGT